MDNAAIKGVGTATVTPFRKDGSVDMPRLEEFIDFQISNGVNFLVPCGTTGETPTLSTEEQLEVVKTYLRLAKGKVPVVAGCTSNNTAAAVEMGKRLKSIGVTHVLSASPYYNKPTQEGIYLHMKTLHQETGLQILLYSVQGRTAGNILPETVARLTEEKIIFAIKEASGSIGQIQQICQLCGDSLTVLCGDDAMTMPLIAVGGQGVISVASNIVPRPMRTWVDTMLEGNFKGARELLKPLLPLFDALFVESNPIPVKAAASTLGLMEAQYRLPLVPPAENTIALLSKVLAPFR